MINWFRHLFMWRKEQKRAVPYDITVIDDLNTKLQQAVCDTTAVSQRIIQKLENQVARAEEELSDREELLSELFTIIPDFLCLKDGMGRWKLVNAYGKRLYGLEGNGYKNKTDSEIALMSPRYQTSFDKCVKTDKEAWAQGAPLQIEEVSVDSFGNETVFDVVKTPVFNADGSRKHLLIHGRNVTEELHNTKHIRMLLNALNKASDAITVTDQDHVIIYANEAFVQTYGYALHEVLDYLTRIF